MLLIKEPFVEVRVFSSSSSSSSRQARILGGHGSISEDLV